MFVGFILTSCQENGSFKKNALSETGIAFCFYYFLNFNQKIVTRVCIVAKKSTVVHYMYIALFLTIECSVFESFSPAFYPIVGKEVVFENLVLHLQK